MVFLSKILTFLSLADKDGNISLTNLGVVVCITKIAIAPTLDWQVISALLLTLLSYNSKRYTIAKATQATTQQNDALADLQERINSISATASKIQDLEQKVNGLVFKGK